MTTAVVLRAMLFVFLIGGAQTRPSSTAVNEALLDAALRNDLPGVIRALDQGADANARGRYDRTALLLAARNANFNMVKLLVERGADVTVEDNLYHRNALYNAVSDRNIEMVQYLIEKGTPAGPDLLASAIERKDPGLVKLVLERGRISDAMLAANHAFHVKAGNTEVVALLRSAMDARPAAANSILTLPPATLRAYIGTYRQDSNTYFPASTAQSVVIAIKDDQLIASLGPRPVMLFPTSESTFLAPETPAVDFKFERRGNAIERVFVNRPIRAREDTTSPYIRVSDATEAPPVVPATISAEDLDVEPAETPRPWPSFRGSGASGIADGQGAVVEWDVMTGRNIRWKTPIPGIANSSPVVWGNRVYISTAISGAGDSTFRTGDYGDTTPVRDLSEHTFKLYALDAQSGQIVWERDVHQGAPRTMRHTKGSHASSTPVTDGRRVVVLFGTAGILAAYDANGELLWKKDLGVLDSGHFYDATVQWGHSSSPIIYQGSVILQVDRQKQSFIAAYNLEDGDELWRTGRDDEIPTWGTPTIVAGTAGDELITNGTKIRGYDPKSGKIRWTLGPNSEITVATPVAGSDLVYVTAGYIPVRPIYAIRPGASGDISLARGARSSPSIAWSSERDGVYIPTPVVYRGLLYTVNNNGIITVFDAQKGERVYRARIGMGGAFSASPVAADGRLYFANEDGEVFVAKAGREYVQLAKNPMNGVIMATPAISNGLIVIRTLHDVYGIGQAPRE